MNSYLLNTSFLLHQGIFIINKGLKYTQYNIINVKGPPNNVSGIVNDVICDDMKPIRRSKHGYKRISKIMIRYMSRSSSTR